MAGFPTTTSSPPPRATSVRRGAAGLFTGGVWILALGAVLLGGPRSWAATESIPAAPTVAGIAPGMSAAPVTAESQFDAAAKLYEGGRAAEAAAVYEGLISRGVATPAVLFNLGNAWLQAGKVGKAIVSYRRAQAIAPRDTEIAAQLNRARLKVGAGATTVEGMGVRALRLLTPNEWAGLALVSVWLWFGSLAAAQLAPKLRPLVSSVATPLAVAALILVSLAGVAGWQAGRTVAVVLASDTTVRFGPLEESQVAFTLPDGAELAVTDLKGAWLGVRDAAGRRGWVLARGVQTIP